MANYSSSKSIKLLEAEDGNSSDQEESTSLKLKSGGNCSISKKSQSKRELSNVLYTQELEPAKSEWEIMNVIDRTCNCSFSKKYNNLGCLARIHLKCDSNDKVDWNHAVIVVQQLHEKTRQKSPDEVQKIVTELFINSVQSDDHLDNIGQQFLQGRTRLSMNWLIDNKKVCLNAFASAYNLSNYQFEQESKAYRQRHNLYQEEPLLPEFNNKSSHNDTPSSYHHPTTDHQCIVCFALLYSQQQHNNSSKDSTSDLTYNEMEMVLSANGLPFGQ